MRHSDTVELLKECSAGIKMAVDSIDEMVDYVQSGELKKILMDSKKAHKRIEMDCFRILKDLNEDDKEPNMMAKGMSWLKTNVKLGIEQSDATIADLITEGSNMGVKSLNRYMNQYKAADEKVRSIAEDLIKIERQLIIDVSQYL